MTWRPFDAQHVMAHLDKLGAVELDGRIRRLDDLAQRALGVAQQLGFVLRHAVGEQVGLHLHHEVFELDVSRMDQRHLEPMYVEVGAALAGQDAGGTIVIGMDVGHEQATQASRAELG